GIELRQCSNGSHGASQRRRGTNQNQQQAFAVQVLPGHFLWIRISLLGGRKNRGRNAFPELVKKTKSRSEINQTGLYQINPGSDLRSHAVTRAVSSAQRGLTS